MIEFIVVQVAIILVPSSCRLPTWLAGATLSLIGGSLIVEFTGLNDLAFDLELVLRSSHDGFLDGLLVTRRKIRNLHLLTDTMRSVLSLQILVRIPVGIVDDDGIGGLQVETETTGSRERMKMKYSRILAR